MKFFALATGLAAALSLTANAQSSSNTSLCDKYTTALFMENNATNQKTLLTLVVNTALIGNYYNGTTPKNNVTGILNNGTFGGQNVSLLSYFDGSLKSTNQNGNAAAVNWLDGGGAAPLKENMAANSTSGNQYTLITHLYEFFGTLLGCSAQNSSSPFLNYQGMQSMSEVHRFMNLDQTENNYFIQEVGLSATSFGVSTEDATTVGNLLNATFNYRCSPPTVLGSGFSNVSQSICLASSCPLANNSDCSQSGESYPNGTSGSDPQSASSSSSSGGSSGGSGSSGKDDSSSLFINALGALALAAAGAIAVSL